MKDQEIKTLKAFFSSAKQMSISLKSTENKLGTFGYHIDRRHLIDIFDWISDEKHTPSIEKNIASSPNRATYLKYTATELFLTIEIILRTTTTHLFFSSKNNKANPDSNIRLKSSKNIKIVSKEGGFKEVQYCYHWRTGMSAPEIYAVGILTGQVAYQSAFKEEKISEKIGSFYANPCLAGDERFKNGKSIINLYSPLALCSQSDYKVSKIPPVDFLFALFKQASAFAWLYSLRMVWRDLKEDNFLIFEDTRDAYSIKMNDFSSVEFINADEKYLENYIGTPAYFPPEHDFFSNLREAKIIEIKNYKKYLYLKNKFNSKLISNLKSDIIKAEQTYLQSRNNVFVIIGEILTKLPDACPQAIKIITECQNETKLMPAEKGRLKFLAHPKDDVWCFSILMVNITTSYLASKSKSRPIEPIKILKKYFDANLTFFREARPTPKQIVGDFMDLFNAAYPPRSQSSIIHDWIKEFNSKAPVSKTLPSSKQLKSKPSISDTEKENDSKALNR